MEHNAFNITDCRLNVHIQRRKMMKLMIALAQNIDPIRYGFCRIAKRSHILAVCASIYPFVQVDEAPCCMCILAK